MTSPTTSLIKLLLYCLEPSKHRIEDLYTYASRNKLAYTLLYRIAECGIDIKGELAREYEKLSLLWEEIVGEAHRVSLILEQGGVEHALFKTVKPYPTVTVDLDILVLGDIAKAYRILRSHGYRVIGIGPESITIASKNVNIDLYREVAVSRIIYFSKKVLRKHIVKGVFGGLEVYMLKPEYDFIVTARHALIKEQMYTLADFYYTYMVLKNQGLKKIIDIIRSLSDEPLKATILYLNIFYNILKGINTPNTYTEKEYPLKISIPSTINLLVDLIAKNTYHSRLPVQVLYTTKPKRLSKLVRGLIHHMKRRTY